MNAQCSTREVHIVHVNSLNVASPSSNVNFVAQLDIPLRNVIKAELLMASISPSTNAFPVVHVYVDELVSNFNSLAGVSSRIGVSGLNTAVGASNGSTSNVRFLESSFAVLPLDTSADLLGSGRVLYNKFANFPTECSYINPIRQLSRLTISVWNPNGTVPTTTTSKGTSYFTFRFECAKDNVCLY
jgi:hypothetical protein